MNGIVNSKNEAIVRITLDSGGGLRADLEAIIDTGFSDYLAIPHEVIEHLRLKFRETVQFRLADGNVATMPVYRTNVLWDGQMKGALAVATSGAPLIGMALLKGSRLQIDVMQGGTVLIEPLHQAS